MSLYIGKDKISALSRTTAAVTLPSTTATAADILSGKTAVDSNANTIVGTMSNNGAVSATLAPTSSSTTATYTVPKGYHNGNGKITVTGQAKTATPSSSAVTVTPDAGKVLTSVTVAAAPYAQVTAEAANVLSGKKFISSTGTVTDGTMVNNGAVNSSVAAGEIYTIPAGYHNGGGIISGVVTAITTCTVTITNSTLAPLKLYNSTTMPSNGYQAIAKGKTVTQLMNLGEIFLLVGTGGVNGGSSGLVATGVASTSATTGCAIGICPTATTASITIAAYGSSSGSITA